MTPPLTAKRISCEQCLRPRGTCICRWITPTAHAVEVVVLQHPLEERSAKGSARLLHLSLVRSRLVAGEAFAESELQRLLRDPFEVSPDPCDEKQAILLYPRSTEDEQAPPIFKPDRLHHPSRLRLIVIDGTWRKSRKMLHLNPLLRTLPRLSLNEVPPSRYLIRKAHRVNQLSTLEATCFAIAQIEGDAERFEPLLRAFDGFVAQQMGYRPEITGARWPETRFD
jgi:DTW domain-containing protein